MRVPFLSLPLLCSLAFAQTPSSALATVRATADAVVPVSADQARVRVAVVTSAATAERAREKNAETANAVILRLRELLGADADIRTASFSVVPKYPGGFSANHTLVIHTAGATAASLDAQEARAEALRRASTQARLNAETIAASLGLRVLRVLSAETQALPAVLPGVPSGPRVAGKTRPSTPLPLAGSQPRSTPRSR